MLSHLADSQKASLNIDANGWTIRFLDRVAVGLWATPEISTLITASQVLINSYLQVGKA